MLTPRCCTPESLVFHQTPGAVDLRDVTQWWRYTPGASWRHPSGPGSSLDGLDRHPVTHVAAEDADVYATWAGKELPTRPNGSSPAAAWKAPYLPGVTTRLHAAR